MSEQPQDLVGHTLLGKLRVLRRLGAGGMGAVYEVEHLLTHNRRALKVLHPRFSTSAEVVSRLVREAGIAGQIGSDAIAETYDVGRLDDGSTYVLMELLEGQTLGELVEARGAIEPASAVRICRRVCEGLSAAHERGFVHRDIKPDNVFLLDSDVAAARIKILDFGITKLLPGYSDRFGNLTETGATPGTPLYMAPEQMRETDDVDARADQYAVGIVLYELIAGQRPFTATTLVGLVTQMQAGEHQPLRSVAPHVSPELEAIVHRAMHRNRDQRFATVAELSGVLAPFESAPQVGSISQPTAPAPAARTGSVTTAAQHTHINPRARDTASRESALGSGLLIGVGVIGLVILLVVGGVAAWIWGGAARESGPPSRARVEPGSGTGPGPGTDIETPTGAVDLDAVAEIARRGRARECLAAAERAPVSERAIALRLSCARSADDWPAYRRACDLQEQRLPAQARGDTGCRHTLELHGTGAVR